MKTEELNKEQVAAIYQEHMTADFPPDERKPLAMIHRAMDAGVYRCFGLMDGDQVAGYAFFVDHHNYFLLDYLAVVRGRRNDGLGAAFLGALRERFLDSEGVLIEIENPEFAQNEEDRILQTRRRNFYLRNGCTDTGVNTTTFGVPFRLLEITDCGLHSPDALRKLYRALYDEILPPELRKNVLI